MYLDVQRLRSFASQLSEQGVALTESRSRSEQTEFGADMRGRLPLLIEGGANTKAVLGASSTVTAEIHHRLIADVLDGLRSADLLWDESEMDDAPDGAFMVIRAAVQIIDPDFTRSLVQQLPQIVKDAEAASGTPPAPTLSRADRRAARRPVNSEDSLSKRQADGIAGVLGAFTPDTVRVRLVRDGEPIAIALVEKDKFVEDLDRLVRRHGYLTSAEWELLGQINWPPNPELYAPDGETIMDVLERQLLGPLRSLGELAGTTAGDEPSVTPLAIYRVIESRGQRGRK